MPEKVAQIQNVKQFQKADPYVKTLRKTNARISYSNSLFDSTVTRS